MTITPERTAVQILAEMDDVEFEAVVNEDTRDRLSPDLKEGLRHTLVIRRWYTSLMKMHKSIEGQFAAKAADNSAKIKKLQAGGGKRVTILTEQASFDQWRAGALRVKNGLEIRLIEAKSILATRGDTFVIDRAAEERNAALGRIGVLEEAIRRHKTTLIAEGDEPTEADETLWGYLS